MLSSGVFGRLTGKRQQGQTLPYGTAAASTTALTTSPVTSPSTDTITSPPLDDVPELERRQTTGTPHRRESSILSLTSSVTDLTQNVRNVRRSVSLRSHRTNPSSSSTSSGRATNYPRNPSMNNLSNISSQLVESPELEQEQDPVHTSPVPPRSRGKLSMSARSFSNRFKSTDTLPILSPEREDEPPPVPNIENNMTGPGGMLAAPTQPRRPPPEKPALISQQSFSRDISQSYSNGVPLQPTTSNLAVNSSYNPTAIYQNIHETAAKRMATIEYMRKVHDGNVFYFSTLQFTSATLATMSSLQQHKLGRRATSYMVLGYSLPALLDMNSNSALEYLKALSALLQEFETYQNLVGFDSSGGSLSRGRVGQMFKSSMGLGTRSGKGRRSSAATEGVTADPKLMLGTPSLSNDPTSPPEIPSPVLGHDFQHLLTPNLPFDPDFSTTYATLCDTLVDTYAKLMDLVTGPEVCTPSIGDAFTKADKAVRKILVSNVVREFDETTRANVKSEVAGLGKLVLGGLM